MSAFGVVANNLNAVNGLLANQQRMINKFKLCWTCQKNKSTEGGKITMLPGLFKFVCSQCVVIGQFKKDEKLRLEAIRTQQAGRTL